MTNIIANGVTYTVESLFGYALYEIITAGTGDSVPRWTAVHLDLIADSKSARDSSAAYLSAVAAAIATGNLNTTTATSCNPATETSGSKTVTLAVDKAFQAGVHYVAVVSAADPTKRLWGPVTGYNSGTKALTFTISRADGSGAFTDGQVIGTVFINGSISYGYLSGVIPLLQNKDYPIFIDAPMDGTILSMRTKCESGTATLTGKIGSTPLGGTANSVSSSTQTQNHTSANVFAAGNAITLTASSATNCVNAEYHIYYKRASV